MSSIRSNDYFRDTLNAALNYFGRKQKQPKKRISNKSIIENTDEDLVEVIDDEENIEIPHVEQANLLHNSYKLFYKRLPPTVARDANIKQGRVREYYRNILSRDNIDLQGIIPLNSNANKFDELDENDIQHVLQQNLDENIQITEDDDELENNDVEEEEEEEQSFEDVNNIEQNDIAKFVSKMSCIDRLKGIFFDFSGDLVLNSDDKLQQATNSEISTIVNGVEKGMSNSREEKRNIEQFILIQKI